LHFRGTTCMLNESCSTSKKPHWIGFDELCRLFNLNRLISFCFCNYLFNLFLPHRH
jgi:hypothetical protein